MITLAQVYLLAGAVFAAFALLCLRDATNPRRLASGAFWGMVALSMLAGDRIGDFGNGLIVLALVALAGFGGLGRAMPADHAAEREAEARRRGNRLFLLAAVIPAAALGGTLGLSRWPWLVDPAQVTLISLSLGVVLALLIALAWLRAPLLQPLEEGRRLMDAVGWAAILPQMLASLGAVFALAGVGTVVGEIAHAAIPEGSRLGAVAAYALGMAGFTMVMGNAFAAFPVMAAAIGLPLLVHQYHGNPAAVAAIGMLAGFCGTLMTPMAANFNVVPAALLGLADRNAVVKAQVPTALPLLAINIALLWFLAFP